MINYGNIWGFLLQTCSVSIAAAFLLVLKRLFAKTLSPRWQYAVWGILALRILLPVSISRYVLIPISVFLETVKGIVMVAQDDEDDEAEEYSSWNYNTQEVREAYYLDAGEELRYVEH